MADIERNGRPLSPHLQVYRWQLSMVTSILNRIAGNALIAGGLLIVWWLLAAATGPGHFAVVNGIVTSWIGILVLVGSVWALWYHALAGVRHLIWDSGRGLDLPAANAMGWGALGGSVVLTAVTVLLA